MMRRLLPFLFALPLTAQAIEIRHFDDPDKQQRYERLIEELRCLVCQNQSLADSDADLAQDLRDEVYTIIQSGKNEEEAVKFLTDRYGDFVLYRPPFKVTTALLWIGPFLLLAAGGALLWRQVKRRNTADDLALTDEEKKRLERLRNNLEG
ncbi:cytochrome c-type biogenesis protein [Methylocaldum sp.]|uniref:cytochrome c-type biogenesis protein n=1 Tax=Methylocaldum sp. TaxID=1969727 RepID=UPI002D28F632|nr:cytochrome c-type biogenesis protein [Methylocaldum sp.]HYE36225.1 cytochrome c-type biogenesis protein [Methylocaldum sp.]